MSLNKARPFSPILAPCPWAHPAPPLAVVGSALLVQLDVCLWGYQFKLRAAFHPDEIVDATEASLLKLNSALVRKAGHFFFFKVMS